ncbi:MAG: DUF790 family protein [Proteobacteria bacterium]|nr:DUF790 family protein [Pseudomonadota bacterium]
MLTLDLVRVRRRGQTLEVVRLDQAARNRANHLAETYIALTKSHVGTTRSELEDALSAVKVHARDRKVAAGLRKLITDRCDFEVENGTDPVELRRAVFGRASAARKALAPGQRFDPAAVLAELAQQRELEPSELERLLYIDLRSAHRLLSFQALDADALVDLYQLGQTQAVLLRAVRVVARVYSSTPGVYRALFRTLKFRRLLYTIEPIGQDSPWAGGYELVIDGPYSLFRSVAKYGLQLALLVPALRACDRWSLDAEVEWGKDRRALSFTTGSHESHLARPPEPSALPDEVAALLDRFQAHYQAKKTLWQARPSTDILALPGAGVCVPDLLFQHRDTGICVYLEVLGYWHRDTVWRRIELVERGLPQQILFAVSERLRVSEAALDADLPGALYVYKGKMNPRIIEARLDQMAEQNPPSPGQGSTVPRK